MSFIRRRDVVCEGDTVIIFLSMNNIHAVEITPTTIGKHGLPIDNKFTSSYGQISVMDLIGKKYGSRIDFSNGWGYLLHPNCELWTKTLPHRTQIIYTPDISLILIALDLKPGSIVCEAGTGSGSLSHAIIRCVQPKGHLYTFDFHEQRVQLAKEDFHKHGLSDWVTVEKRDVISEGFQQNSVDGIFLDLPNPWEIVPKLKNTIKRGGRLCTFSPCIEQVQKTVEALKKSNLFIQIKTQEVLQRPLSVQSKIIHSIQFDQKNPSTGNSPKIKLEPITKNQTKFTSLIPPLTISGHTGYITFATFVNPNINLINQ